MPVLNNQTCLKSHLKSESCFFVSIRLLTSAARQVGKLGRTFRNFLQIHKRKAEIIVLGSKMKRINIRHLDSKNQRPSLKSWHSNRSHFHQPHQSMTKTALRHLRNIVKNTKRSSSMFLFPVGWTTVMVSLLVTKQTIKQLQLIQNAAAISLIQDQKERAHYSSSYIFTLASSQLQNAATLL